MKLYYSPGSCSLAPHIVLQELGFKFDLVPVDLKTKQYSGGDFYQINPKGAVPTLEFDNGQYLTETAVILQYLADLKPESGLMPKSGTNDRYRAQEWLNYISTEIHKGFGPLWSSATSEEYKSNVRTQLGKKFDFLTSRLKGNAFVFGNQFTVCDAYLTTVLGWSTHVGVDLTKWPALMGYVEKVRSRPSVQSAMKAENLK